MSVSSISTSTPVQLPTKVASSEAGEATRGGKDVRNDGAADDAASAANASAAKPVTNTLGELIGRNLNVKV